MKCQEAKELLVAYLDNELSPSERALIHAHLAECDGCQEELAALAATRTRLSHFLHVRAAEAVPSPQAWSRLQARLAGEARPSPSWLPIWLQRLAPGVGYIHSIFGGVTVKRGLVWTAVAVLAIVLSVITCVPSVRAQVGELLRWFRFESPGGGGEVSIPGSVEWTPLRPTYLPAGFQAMAIGFNPEEATLNYWNSTTNQLLIINEHRVSSGEATSLPSGTRVTVHGQPATLITGLEGSVALTFLPPTPEPPHSYPPTYVEGSTTVKIPYPTSSALTPVPAGSDQAASEAIPLEPVMTLQDETISYTDGRQLVWYAGDLRIEMVSTLPVEEMLKVAESMAPAEEDFLENP